MGKVLKTAGLALVAVALVLVLLLLWYRSASQAQVEGNIKLEGLTAAVDIVRDAEGIPHIYAQSSGDAYFALGFVHAQDRLWQMEMNRRIAAGRMAEVLGPNALNTDRFLRTLGVRRNAEAILTKLSAETRAALDAYSKGVNAYLGKRSQPLPPEFLLAGAPAPEPWQPVDSIGWQTMMSWDLGDNWSRELMRMRLAQRLSLAEINEFLPPYPGDAVQETRDYTQLYRELAGTTQQLTAVRRMAPPGQVDGMGSNNWVVAGALSETGKPLLANDPHLGLAVPAVWYFAHLAAPGLNVIGATLPGIPSVVLGHNERVAWGFTNTGPDVQDLYIERINPDNGKQYQTPEGWAEFKTRQETIAVKGQADVHIEVRESRHGPVITGALPIVANARLDAKQYVIAFAWTALRPDDLTMQAGIKLDRARNWEEFLAAARDFSSPQQNVVYADVDGNIGYVAPARVPIRKAANDLKGLAPAPGWDARYDWDGFIPFEQLPRQYNPAAQRVITANHKVVGDDYAPFLTSEWTLPFRFKRIEALLDARPKHSLASFAAIQKDSVSLAAQELLPLVLKAKPLSERAEAALQTLAKWDGSMRIDSAEALIFNAWMREAARQIFSDKLGADLFKDYWEERNVHRPLVNILKNETGQGRWCVARNPAAAGAAKNCAELLSMSLEAALTDLERRYGANRAAWRWGEAHAARSEHRPFGKVASLAKLFDIRLPSPGDAFTVNVGRNNPGDEAEPYTSRHAASLRALYDLADLENSRFIHSTGQSGNRLSPLYDSYAQRWSQADYLPMRTKRATVEANKLGTLTLSP